MEGNRNKRLPTVHMAVAILGALALPLLFGFRRTLPTCVGGPGLPLQTNQLFTKFDTAHCTAAGVPYRSWTHPEWQYSNGQATRGPDVDNGTCNSKNIVRDEDTCVIGP